MKSVAQTYEKELAKLLLETASYTYKIDLTTGMVYDEIVDKNGFCYTKALNLDTPCNFDELIKRSFNEDYLQIQYTLESNIKNLSCKELLDAYEQGERRVEATIYYPREKAYNRLNYFLDKDEETQHIIAYVLCLDVSNIEYKRRLETLSAQRELAETDDIVNAANVGIWKIFLFQGEQPRMSCNRKMMQLLGVDSQKLTEEEIYDAWYSHIKPESLPSVKESVSEMIAEGHSENTYTWCHPVLGDLYVRCGGTSQYIKGKGHILKGYHSDVTEIVKNDMKYKQLLSNALEETKRQKKLLQEALDNYKQADYDRRTDFLTGLRNRQDMFELLHDTLSGKREDIQSMFMMDIDNFKMLNDNYGHTFGDECLKRVAAAVLAYGHQNGLYFYRYGGEEILGICLNKEKPAATIAEELLDAIRSLRIERDDLPEGYVTVSLGYTADNSRFEKMIDKADRAMYLAKANGKNRAVCFEGNE